MENVWATPFYLNVKKHSLNQFQSLSVPLSPTSGTQNVLHAKQILQQSLKVICFEMTWNMVKKKYMGNSLDLIYKILLW